jgi:hypothetical protein
VTGENEWIFALQQQQVLIPNLNFSAAVRSQKAEFATVQRPKTARNACKSESIRVLHAATGTNLNLKSKTPVSASDQSSVLAKKKSKTSLLLAFRLVWHSSPKTPRFRDFFWNFLEAREDPPKNYF